MLGMFLVVLIMALLLGGTLHGLASYRAVMGTCDSKLEELGLAVKIKDEISKLKRPTAASALQTGEMLDRIPHIQERLNDYAEKLNETIARGRALDDGKTELN